MSAVMLLATGHSFPEHDAWPLGAVLFIVLCYLIAGGGKKKAKKGRRK